MSFKDISILAVQWSRTVCSIMVEGILMDSVKLFLICTSGSGDVV